MLCDEVENNGGEVKNVVIRTYFSKIFIINKEIIFHFLQLLLDFFIKNF
jgi:hypothetical protein